MTYPNGGYQTGKWQDDGFLGKLLNEQLLRLTGYDLSSMKLPFRVNDLLLLVVVLSSMAAGIIFPHFSSLFQALPIYCLMVLFSLSYLSIELDTVWRTLKGHSRTILTFTVLKSLILPVVVFLSI